jgi:3-oxoadipate enol-lactonase
MPYLENPGLRTFYQWDGREGAPVVVLSHSLGTDVTMWDPQVPALAERFRVLRYDTRGHGRTAVTPGPYSIAGLAKDVLDLLDGLDVSRAHFCGLSMGGLIGMWLGAHAHERLGRLVLSSTGAKIGSAESWNQRIQTVQAQGMAGISSSVVERWFSAELRSRAPQVAMRAKALLEATPPKGYAACAAAIRDADERDDLRAIPVPTLVISGGRDPATPPADGRLLTESITSAEYLELPAAHLSNLEAPEAFTTAVVGFLTRERRG